MIKEEMRALRAAEDFVRKVLSKDLKQKNISNAMVKRVAAKVSKAMPIVSKQRKAA